MSRRRLWAAAIVACAWLAWAGTLRVGFIWDDHFTVENNPALSAWTWTNLKHDFATGLFSGPHKTDFYRPLVAIANRIDYTLYGRQAWGYHLTNLMIHTGSCLLIALLLAQLGFSPLIAGLTACLYAVHPINAQDMILVTGRCGLLALFFTLLALVGFQSSRRFGLGLGIAAYVLGLCAKESVVVVPALFALTLWARRRWDRAAGYAFAALAVVTVGYLLVYRQVGFVTSTSLVAAHELRFMARVFPGVLAAYAQLVAVPLLLYSERIVPQNAVHGVWAFAALVALGVWLYRQRVRWPLFSFAWIIVSFLPPTFMMISQRFMLDHWAYPALLGFLLPVAVGLSMGLASARAAPRWLCGALTAVLLLGWAGLAEWNVAKRGTDLDFFRWSARYSPSETIHSNLQTLELQRSVR